MCVRNHKNRYWWRFREKWKGRERRKEERYLKRAAPFCISMLFLSFSLSLQSLSSPTFTFTYFIFSYFIHILVHIFQQLQTFHAESQVTPFHSSPPVDILNSSAGAAKKQTNAGGRMLYPCPSSQIQFGLISLSIRGLEESKIGSLRMKKFWDGERGPSPPLSWRKQVERRESIFVSPFS